MNRAIDLIKKFEGCRLKSYKCPAGVWTIGYGSTGPGIGPGLEWTQEQAEGRLIQDIYDFVLMIGNLVSVKLNDNQLSALVSLVYNIGIGAFKTSTILNLINLNKLEMAADQFPRWNKSGRKVLPGLVKRREEEQKLFLTPME